MYGKFVINTRNPKKIIDFDHEGGILKRVSKYVLPKEFDFTGHRLILLAGGERGREDHPVPRARSK